MPVGRTGGFGEQLLLHGCFVRALDGLSNPTISMLVLTAHRYKR